MKLGKVTNTGKGGEKRWYDDACGTALALEFVGERWSLLVIRELMFGPRRFGELKANLPGISANVLTQRLEALVAAGIAERRRLPSPANVQVYDLTAWGRESEPILQTMGRWATRSPRHDPTLFLSPASARMSLRTMVPRERGERGGRGGEAMTIAFRFPGDAFVARLTPGDLVIARDGGEGGETVGFACDVPTLAAIVYRKWPLAEAEAAGALVLTGDRAAAQRFVDLFALPEKIGQGDDGSG